MGQNLEKACGSTAIVVNDDRIQLEILSRLLEKEGLTVFSCLGVSDALEVMSREHAPDLIVTDLHMPEIDGWRFCRLLRSPEYAEFNQTPILVVSATYSGEDSRQITAELGANAFLPAPIDSHCFLRQTRALLAGEIPRVRTNVLIVEDEEAVALGLKWAFESHGYRVEVAGRGAEGRELLQRRRQDIVVLDYHLPDMLGDELLEEIRKLHPQSVSVMMTGDPSPELAIEWMHKGASAYVQKPFDFKYCIALCEKARRERSLLYVEELLEERTVQLRESENRHRAVFENTGAATVILEEDETILLSNNAFARLAGYDRQAIEGNKKIGEFLRGDGGDGEAGPGRPLALADAVARSGECKFVGRAESAIHVLLAITRIPETARRVVSIADLTDRISAEKERRNLEARIQQAKKAESLQVMAGSIAHHFNNLLTVIRGFHELALADLPAASAAQDSLQEAGRATARAMELSKLMLTFVGQGKDREVAINLSRLTARMQTELNGAVHRQVSVKMRLADEKETIQGDPAQLRQAILNLVRNASEAIGQAEGEILISTSVAAFEPHGPDPLSPLEGMAAEECVVLEVRDTGCGMGPETLEQAFDPFFTTKFLGRGLGLAAVQGIVRGHGGVIGVVSKPQQGTVVKVMLPLRRKRSIAC